MALLGNDHKRCSHVTVLIERRYKMNFSVSLLYCDLMARSNYISKLNSYVRERNSIDFLYSRISYLTFGKIRRKRLIFKRKVATHCELTPYTKHLDEVKASYTSQPLLTL